MSNTTTPSLWGIRLVFILCLTVISTAIGGYIGYLQPNKSIVSAQVEKPRVVDLNNYFSLLTTYRLVNDEPKMTDEQITDFVYQDFSKQLSSTQLLKTYLQEQEFSKNLALFNGISTEQQVEDLVNYFSVTSLPNGILQIEVVNPIKNNQILENVILGFIEVANEQAKKALYEDLVHKWKLLFQQVKLASDNNLSESWKGKLQIMLSVQPLDDRLMAYAYVQRPIVMSSIMTNNLLKYGVIGAGIGVILSVLFSLLFIRIRYLSTPAA